MTVDEAPQPGDRRRPLLILTTVAVVVALGGGLAAVIVGGPTDDEDMATPATEPAPVETATPPPSSHPEEEPPEPDPEVVEIVEQVAELRGLKVPETIDARLVDGETLARTARDTALAEVDPDELAEASELLATLRLAPADFDLEATLEPLYEASVLGLYDPAIGTMFIRDRSGGLGAGEKLTAAHEAVHALQDAAFDLEALIEGPDDDARLAGLAVAEGDAVLTERRWQAAHQDEDERAEARATQLEGADPGALAQIPRYVLQQFAFPYTDGVTFTQAVYDAGGHDAVNAALSEPPATTAEIMNPQRYLDGVEPVEVAAPGGEGEQEATSAFGAFTLRELLEPLGEETASDIAAGWAGGAIATYPTDEAMTPVAARLTFSGGTVTQRACDALGDWYAVVAEGSPDDDGVYAGDRDFMALDCGFTDVTFALAADRETALGLAGG